jgi:glyoxylase-like metal-dependent hydrolase (beta-lactamase superfamily II)
VSRHFNLQKLADGVYAAIHNDDGGFAIGNAGIIDLGDKTVVIDTFLTPVAARDLKSHAEFLTGRPVTYVINTHYHNDHTRGNQVFKDEADILASTSTKDQLSKTFYTQIEEEKESNAQKLAQLSGEIKSQVGRDLKEARLWLDYYLALEESLDELTLTLPNIVIDVPFTLNGPSRSLQIFPKPGGHTDGDLIVWIPEDKIVFMGDQLFVKRHPYLGEGDLSILKAILDWVGSFLDPAICVAGHGPVGQKGDLEKMANYIDFCTDQIGKAREYHRGLNYLNQVSIPKPYQSWLLSRFFQINLHILYEKANSNQ